MRLLLFCERDFGRGIGEREGKGKEGDGMGLMAGWLADWEIGECGCLVIGDWGWGDGCWKRERERGRGKRREGKEKGI